MIDNNSRKNLYRNDFYEPQQQHFFIYSYNVFLYFLDFLFLCDIIATFFSAFEDFDLKINDNLKDIAINYLKGWFFIDFVSIFPIDLIFSYTEINIGGYNKIFRVLRMGKL